MDNMFISGGENIFPENIERALLELPGIEQAIVVPRDDEEFGARPIVFVDASLDHVGRWTEAMRARLRGFEVPVAFLAWPNDAHHGIKPSRAKLRELGNQST
jgi:O-succinylbenzoic acid--CoA ligase